MPIRLVCYLSVLLTGLVYPFTATLANDSSASFGIGGLVLAQNDSISMVSEDLYVSRTKVSVDYTFRNNSDRDIRTIVAFPMPELPPLSDDFNPHIPFLDQGANFVGFETKVNGGPVRIRVELRALAAGVDRTRLLRAHKISPLHYSEKVMKKLRQLPDDVITEFETLGLVRRMNGVEPAWTLRATFYWPQTFPAKQDVKISHAYTPVVGSFAGTLVGTEYAGQSGYQTRYCVDAKLEAAVKQAQDKKFGLTDNWFEYVLKTGANWAGPISRFRLVVDKGEPHDFVSFCGENRHKDLCHPLRDGEGGFLSAGQFADPVHQRLSAGELTRTPGDAIALSSCMTLRYSRQTRGSQCSTSERPLRLNLQNMRGLVMKVGFIGVGLMGHGMAANLLKAGHELTVIAHRNREPVEDLVSGGAAEAESLAELAGKSDCIVLCVTNAQVAESVMDQLFDHLTVDHLIIDTSTSDPLVTERLAERLAAKGVAFADAPLTGGAQQAAEGVLGAIVGGTDAAYERARPVLDAFCTRIGHFGPAGAGHRAKLINNYLVLAMVAAIADTYNVARKAGIDWAPLLDVMKCGSNYSEALRRMVEPALEGDHDGYRFTLHNARKDVAYYMSFADGEGLTSDLAREVMAIYERSVAAGHGDLFVSRMIDPETAGKDADA